MDVVRVKAELFKDIGRVLTRSGGHTGSSWSLAIDLKGKRHIPIPCQFRMVGHRKHTCCGYLRIVDYMRD
jgi:hypothetical protein